jgi:hypothetical protein
MKAKELIEILSKNPEQEVVVAIGSFRIDIIKSVDERTMCEDLQKPNVPIFRIVPEHYKSVETKGIDYP